MNYFLVVVSEGFLGFDFLFVSIVLSVNFWGFFEIFSRLIIFMVLEEEFEEL